MSTRSYTATGIVLKRFNWGEADRIVTLYTQEFGKVTALAKGIRKLTSSKKAALEPAAHSRCQFVIGRNWDLITQAQLLNSHAHVHQNLVRLTQTLQLLEIVDLLTAEKQDQPEIYTLLLEALQHLEADTDQKHFLLEQIRLMLQQLGFTHNKEFSEKSLKEYIEELSQHKLRAKRFLTIQNS